jgi:hypothetical protein
LDTRVQTSERYLGCKQRLSQAVNDKLGLEDTQRLCGWRRRFKSFDEIV